MRHAVSVMTCAILGGCVANGAILVHDDDVWVEHARRAAIANCATFYDTQSGDFEITYRADSVTYVGSPDLLTLHRELRIEMNHRGEPTRLANDSFQIYPEDFLSKGTRKQRCRSYGVFHDAHGRQTATRWKPYALPDG